MGCHFLLQGIFLTQGSNPGLLYCRQTLYCLNYQGSLSSSISDDKSKNNNGNYLKSILVHKALSTESGIVVVQSLNSVRLFAIPWTVALQAPPSMGFSRQEYWSGLPFPSPEDLPHPRLDPRLLHWQLDSLPLSHLGSPCYV